MSELIESVDHRCSRKVPRSPNRRLLNSQRKDSLIDKASYEILLELASYLAPGHRLRHQVYY